MASKTGQVIYLKKGDRGPSLRGPMDWEKMATGFQFQCGAAGEDFLFAQPACGVGLQFLQYFFARTVGLHDSSNSLFWIFSRCKK